MKAAATAMLLSFLLAAPAMAQQTDLFVTDPAWTDLSGTCQSPATPLANLWACVSPNPLTHSGLVMDDGSLISLVGMPTHTINQQVCQEWNPTQCAGGNQNALTGVSPFGKTIYKRVWLNFPAGYKQPIITSAEIAVMPPNCTETGNFTINTGTRTVTRTDANFACLGPSYAGTPVGSSTPVWLELGTAGWSVPGNNGAYIRPLAGSFTLNSFQYDDSCTGSSGDPRYQTNCGIGALAADAGSVAVTIAHTKAAVVSSPHVDRSYATVGGYPNVTTHEDRTIPTGGNYYQENLFVQAVVGGPLIHSYAMNYGNAVPFAGGAIGPGPHCLENIWHVNSAAGVADGSFEFWIDGVRQVPTSFGQGGGPHGEDNLEIVGNASAVLSKIVTQSNLSTGGASSGSYPSTRLQFYAGNQWAFSRLRVYYGTREPGTDPGACGGGGGGGSVAGTIAQPASPASGSITLTGTCTSTANVCNSWQPRLCNAVGAGCANWGTPQVGAGPYSVIVNTNSVTSLDGTYTVGCAVTDTGPNNGSCPLLQFSIKNAITPRQAAKR